MARRSENVEESHAVTEWLEIDSIRGDRSHGVGIDDASHRL
jgi:hypothetical protein